MAKTAEITLGSVKFTAHKFNIGEHEQLAEVVDGMTHGDEQRERHLRYRRCRAGDAER